MILSVLLCFCLGHLQLSHLFLQRSLSRVLQLSPVSMTANWMLSDGKICWKHVYIHCNLCVLSFWQMVLICTCLVAVQWYRRRPCGRFCEPAKQLVIWVTAWADLLRSSVTNIAEWAAATLPGGAVSTAAAADHRRPASAGACSVWRACCRLPHGQWTADKHVAASCCISALCELLILLTAAVLIEINWD